MKRVSCIEFEGKEEYNEATAVSDCDPFLSSNEMEKEDLRPYVSVGLAVRIRILMNLIHASNKHVRHTSITIRTPFSPDP